MNDKSRKPDYELDEHLLVTKPEQFKAVGDLTRHRIIMLLSEKAATTSQLSEALGQPKGSIGHHLKVLESAGLIRVVRTRQVRALTEKYYGRTARLFRFLDPERQDSVISRFFGQIVDEHEAPDPNGEWPDELLTAARARIPASKARDFEKRLEDLITEFRDSENVPGERVYGCLVGLYLTNLPEIPSETSPEDESESP